MSRSAGASRREPRFRGAGRSCKADRAARGYDRIDRSKQTVLRGDGGSPASAGDFAVLRFGEPCTKDGRFFLLPRQRPRDFQGPSMSGFSTARQKMVDGQVRPSDVTDIRILDAMLTVPREAFVPENRRALAYLDLNLDISEGGSAKRFLIQPAVSAKMLQAADIKNTDNVLVAGCATGYTAALVARIAARVTATETDPEHAAKARDLLAQLGLENVTFRAAAPSDGDPANAPYDVIVLD